MASNPGGILARGSRRRGQGRAARRGASREGGGRQHGGDEPPGALEHVEEHLDPLHRARRGDGGVDPPRDRIRQPAGERREHPVRVGTLARELRRPRRRVDAVEDLPRQRPRQLGFAVQHRGAGVPVALHAVARGRGIHLLGHARDHHARRERADHGPRARMGGDHGSQLLLQGGHHVRADAAERALLLDGEEEGGPARVGRGREDLRRRRQVGTLGDEAKRRRGAALRGGTPFAQALDGVEGELDLAAGVEAVAGEQPVAARERGEPRCPGEGGSLGGDLGDAVRLAGDEQHGSALDGAHREARPGAVQGDGDDDRGRVRSRGGVGDGCAREIHLRRRERHRHCAGREPQEDEGAGTTSLEEGGDLLLHARPSEEAGGGVHRARRHDGGDEAPVDQRGAHPADGDERAVDQRRLLPAVEGAGADLDGDAALVAAAQPPADAVMTEGGREAGGDVGVDQLVPLFPDALGTPEAEDAHRLQAELVDAAVARLDPEAIRSGHFAPPDGEGGRLAQPQGGRALGEGAQLGPRRGQGRPVAGGRSITGRIGRCRRARGHRDTVERYFDGRGQGDAGGVEIGHRRAGAVGIGQGGLHGGEELLGGLEALGAIARHGTGHDGAHRGRDARGPGRERLGVALADVDDEAGVGGLDEGGGARDRLVEDGAHGPEVGAVIDVGRALDLLGRHVKRCPQHGAVAGERIDPGASVLAGGELGQAEVDDLDVEALLLARDEEEVLRLEVPVDDAGGVRPAETPQGVGGDRQGVRRGEATASEAGGEVLSLEELHDEEGVAGLGLAGVENLDDVGAVHGGDGARLAVEAGPGRGVVLADEHELERHALADGDVLRLVDAAHAAAADQPEDPVLAGGDRPDAGVLARGARYHGHALLVAIVEGHPIIPERARASQRITRAELRL